MNCALSLSNFPFEATWSWAGNCHIGITETVDDLKEKIKEKNPNMMRFDAPLLNLYLARDGGTWLNSNNDDIKALKRREVPDRIKNLMQEEFLLDETVKLNDDDYFGKRFSPRDREIHVLVELPEDPKEVLHYKSELVCW